MELKVGQSIKQKKGLGTQSYGKIIGIHKTPFGLVYESELDQKSFYTPHVFVTQVEGNTAITRKNPFTNRFWEEIIGRLIATPYRAIGTILGFKEVNGDPRVVVQAGAVPKQAIMEILQKMGKPKKTEREFMGMVEKELKVPYFLGVHPVVVHVFCENMKLETPDLVFVDKLELDIPHPGSIDDKNILLPEHFKILDYTVQKPGKSTLVPPPVELSLKDVGGKSTEVNNRLSSILKSSKLKYEEKEGDCRFSVILWDDSYLNICSKVEGHDLIFRLTFDVDWSKYPRSPAGLGWLVLGIVGWAIWGARQSNMKKIVYAAGILLKDPKKHPVVDKVIEYINQASEPVKS